MTSWEKVGQWYGDLVGDQGHYYHRQVILPRLLPLLELEHYSTPHLLDIACGQGVLARCLPPHVAYTGVDASPALIKKAKQLAPTVDHRFITADVTRRGGLPKGPFSHAVILLAIQNIATPAPLLRQVSRILEPQGSLIIICNHPCFRIPRHSSWGVDRERRIQYRRLDRYLSSLHIPIQAHPSRGEESAATDSFHHPLSDYFEWLYGAGFAVDCLEEWCSDKQSEGGCAQMENRARQEFPLFLALRAKPFANKKKAAVKQSPPENKPRHH